MKARELRGGQTMSGDYVVCPTCARPPFVCRCNVEREAEEFDKMLKTAYRSGYVAASRHQQRQPPYIVNAKDATLRMLADEWRRGFDSWTLRYKPMASSVPQ